MSGRDEALGLAHVEATRRVLRRAMTLCHGRGAAIDDVAIGALYAAFDVAEQHAGNGMSAIHWLRTGLDLIEQGATDGEWQSHACLH